MLEVASSLVSKLGEIEVVFANKGGRAKDDSSQYALTAGLFYPIVKVANTVLAKDDISSFKLSLGYSSPIPTLTVVIDDGFGNFRESDYIEKTSDLLVWLGCKAFDADTDKTVDKPKPIKLGMQVVDIKLKQTSIIVKGRLKLPTERFTIAKNTVENMLKAFADATGIGVLCNYALLSEQVDKNFVNVTAEEFITDFCKFIGIQDWFIDSQYNLCMLDIAATCSEHKELQCKTLFSSFRTLDTAQPVRYTNYLNDITQFKYVQYGYSFIDRDNELPVVENVVYDKATSPAEESYQRTEQNFLAKPAPIDTDNIYFEAAFDPYKQVGKTFQIDAYTSAGRPKRMATEQYENDEKPPTGQQKIEDICGVYMLTDVIYLMSSYSNLQAWTSFQKPTENGV